MTGAIDDAWRYCAAAARRWTRRPAFSLSMRCSLPAMNRIPGKVMDILLMVLSEGRERTEGEFRELYARAGLELTKVIPTRSVLSIVEGGGRT